jgi:nickel-dependent lactate racemase
MSGILAMNYGSHNVPLAFKKESARLSHREPPVSVNPDTFRELLATSLPLPGSEVSDVGIVVADKTRLCEYPTYLPILTNHLLEAGLLPSNITFYIAYGTHAPQSDAECLESYGETYKKFRFVHHKSRAEEGFRTLGTTSRGTSIRIANEVLRHELLITFGAILHHYFAGYGGGRKLLFPGLAAYESILENHRLFLDFNTRTPAIGCQSGQLGNNPLALDLEEISSMLPPRLEIHALLNSEKQVCELYAGRNYADFRKVCQRYDLYFRSTDKQQYDLVVASAGGYPKDINFIQAHKSIHNAASFVKNGGKLVIFAECRDGIGNPDFMDIFKWGGREQIFEYLEVAYKNNAGTALSMLEKSERIDIHLVTSLSKVECGLMGASRCTAEDVQKMIDFEQGSVMILENAGMLYK